MQSSRADPAGEGAKLNAQRIRNHVAREEIDLLALLAPARDERSSFRELHDERAALADELRANRVAMSRSSGQIDGHRAVSLEPGQAEHGVDVPDGVERWRRD